VLLQLDDHSGGGTAALAVAAGEKRSADVPGISLDLDALQRGSGTRSRRAIRAELQVERARTVRGRLPVAVTGCVAVGAGERRGPPSLRVSGSSGPENPIRHSVVASITAYVYEAPGTTLSANAKRNKRQPVSK